MTLPHDERPWAAHIKLAIPLAAQQAGFQLMGTVDAALLGHHDEASLAAAGLGNNLLFAITSVAFGIVMGLDTVIPQAIGARQIADARRYLAAGLRLAVIVGLASSVVVLAAPLVLELTAMPRVVAEQARIYTWLRAIGVVPFLLSVALRSYLAAHNVTQPLVVVVIVGNIVNALLDVVLIFGVDAIGLPPLGVVGAAIATCTVQLAIVGVYYAAVRALDAGAPPPRSRPGDIATIMRYGLPVGGHLAAEIGIFGVATVLAAHLGETSGAAHSIALNLSSFTFSLAVGIGSATNVRVGHAIGAGDRVAARRRGMHGFALGLVGMGACALVFVTMPGVVARLFTDDPDVIAATIALLQIAALFQLSDGTQAIAAGALRGIGDTRATFVANVVGHYAIGLTISLALCFGAGMGVVGLWWGLSAGLTATAIFLVLRFVRATRA